jgi:hypothetical protein
MGARILYDPGVPVVTPSYPSPNKMEKDPSGFDFLICSIHVCFPFHPDFAQDSFFPILFLFA